MGGAGRAIGLNVLIALAYSVTGWLGLQLPYYGEHVTLAWAPAAIALAAIVHGGVMTTPGILVGAFGVNFAVDPSDPAHAAMIAVGNTLGPATAGLVLVRVYELRPQLDRVRDAIAYVSIGVLGTSLLTSTAGALSLYAFGDAPWADVPMAWLAWLGGDAAGLLIIGPLLLTWLSAPDPNVSKVLTLREQAAMLVVVALFSVIVLEYGARLISLPYAFGLVFLWILLRAGPRGASLAIAVVATTLVVGTAFGLGPFIAQPPHLGMLSLWVFLAAVGSASVTAGALVAERDRALHHQRRLLGELDHRVKNTLATVVAIAERSGDGAVDVADYRDRFVGRIRAIARTHEGMARSDWRAMQVDEVVAMTLAPFNGTGPGHLLASGSAISLVATIVAPLTMVLHELATNAAKYGAWSRPGGGVAVTWDLTADQMLRLTWRETGGPESSTTPAPGYGLRLIEGLVCHELAGRAELEFAPSGLLCTLHIPLASA